MSDPDGRPLLHSPGRKAKLVRRPLDELGAKRSSSPARRTRRQKLGLDDGVHKAESINILDEISCVGKNATEISTKSVASAISPPNGNYMHSSPYEAVDNGPLKPRRSSSRTKKKNLGSSPSSEFRRLQTAQDSQEEEGEEESFVNSIRQTKKSSATPTKRNKHDVNTRKGETESNSLISEAAIPEEGSHSNARVTVAVLILAALLGLGWYYNSLRNVDSGLRGAIWMLDEEFERLKEVFPSQSSRTWRVLKSNFRRINENDNDQAACITIVGESPQVDCFARAVVDCLIRGRNGSDDDKTEALRLGNRERIYEKVEEKLKRNDAVVISDIDKVDGETAMGLHPFCDNAYTVDAHPFVHSAVISTINAKNVEKINAEEFAGELLSKVWQKSVSEDKISSLISRVVLSAIDFEHEALTNNLESLCSGL